MTSNGVKDLYDFLTTAWPTVVKPGASEGWKAAMMKNLFEAYKKYNDEEVLLAFRNWTQNNDKYPTTKNIINELKWSRMNERTRTENEELWPMDFMREDGTEWSYGMFRRVDFINHRRNPNRLDPEEWERRYIITRRRIMDKIWKELKEEERKNASNKR